MSEFDSARPDGYPGAGARPSRPDAREPATDAPPPSSGGIIGTSREGVERKAELLERRAGESRETAPSPADSRPADRTIDAAGAPADARSADRPPQTPAARDQPAPAATAAERKAALLETRAADADRGVPRESREPSPTTPGPATSAERKAALLDAHAAQRSSPAELAPVTEGRPPADTPRTTSPQDTPPRPPDGPHARATDAPARPEISEKVFQHILHGEWNKKGRPVGFHSAPDGQPPPDRRITSIEDRKSDGTYHADVEFRHPTTGEWKRKDVPEHTMFPNHWPEQKVRDAVQKTYEKIYDNVIEPRLGNNESLPKKSLRDSYDGVLIQLYVSPDGELRTAFPIQKSKSGEPR
ncbi:EndoU domain-containing protein [Frankia sp. QA3]|uniref:EndoU domain-containing protein n=1 Tax=Frankia sp. QA3 TaxID=710111 RepID=UPI000269CD92|nr:EndoU domain-containing protein [Frankia sp. QA3]EIV96137.1 hypothetical protein FraQA3DRAFT_6000 [Frankia sp. QA3]